MMSRTQIALFTSHNDVWITLLLLYAPRSGGGLWLRRWLITHNTEHCTWPSHALAPFHAPEPVTDNHWWGIFVTFVTWALLSHQCPSLISGAGEHHNIVSVWVILWFFFCCEPFSVLESIKLIKTTLSLTITYGWWYPCPWCICSAQSNLFAKYWLHYKHSTFPAFSPQLI